MFLLFWLLAMKQRRQHLVIVPIVLLYMKIFKRNYMKKLIEHWSSKTDSYDVIMSKLTYMDSFVREVLRMHPIAIQIVNRQCTEDTQVAGYDIQAGFTSGSL